MKFTIGDQIGDPGGFGSVYLYTSEAGEKYAIKILNNMDAVSTERFKKEIRLTMRLAHPNIVRIITYDADSSQKYYIMPLYNSSLKAVIPELYGKYDRQYSVISEVLNGVIYLHSEGVLHRDLKPQNILYNSDTDIVINDFGLGRQIDSESDRLTRIGDGFGTQRYTAPEQFTDAINATEKSDVFSLGKILEDIVTNMLSATIHNDDLRYIIDKCTQQNPDTRFSSAMDLKVAIDSVYQRLLGIAESNTTDDVLLKIKLGNVNNQEIHELAMRFLSYRNGDKLEEFFHNIFGENYQFLEQSDKSLTENLVVQLSHYYTGQAWGFGYTDIIGDNCKRLYILSNNVKVKANLLYTIIKVGILHNRWYVMGLARELIQSANLSECIELTDLLANGHVNLKHLIIEQDDLPMCLRSYYERHESEQLVFDF